MSDSTEGNFYIELEKLSIPELESLLQQNFVATNEDKLDTDYIIKITELICKKEKETSNYENINVDQAWNDFETYYNTQIGKTNFLYQENQKEGEATPPSTVPLRKKSNRKRHTIRRAIIMAAVLACLLAMLSIPVLGYGNIFQMIGHWTSEQFKFSQISTTSEQTSSDKANSKYASLQDALSQHGIVASVMPKVIPSGFKLQEVWVKEYPETGDIEFSAPYVNGDDDIVITIIQHEGGVNKNFEKGGQDVQEYSSGNIVHYIFHNDDFITAAWYVGSLECSINTTLSVPELEKMIDSIY